MHTHKHSHLRTHAPHASMLDTRLRVDVDVKQGLVVKFGVGSQLGFVETQPTNLSHTCMQMHTHMHTHR